MRTKDMTNGRPAGLLFRFALPVIFGNIFQQLYTVVDTAVVGRGLGVDALAAIGSTDWYSWLMFGLIQGLTQGFGIRVAQKFGEKDAAGLKKSIGNTFLLSGAIAIAFTLLFEMSVSPALAVMKIPEAIRPLSRVYLSILFAGIAIVTLYNVLAVILRSLGDSRTPVVAMVIATLINIALDLLFVLKLGWGVGGAAFATLIAQAVSTIFCAVKLHRIEEARPSRADLKPDTACIRELIRLGAPVGFQNAVIAVGGIVVQTVVDMYGVVFIAGYTATNKLYGLLECAAVAYGYAVTTYTGQNYGAKKYERIRRGVRSAAAIALGSCVLISAAMLLFGRYMLGLFVDSEAGQAEQTLQYAYEYLRIMSLPLPVLYALHISRSALQGIGRTQTTMISGFVELFCRVASAFLLPGICGYTGLYLAEIVAWVGADAVLFTGYAKYILRLVKTDQ